MITTVLGGWLDPAPEWCVIVSKIFASVYIFPCIPVAGCKFSFDYEELSLTVICHKEAKT